MENGSEDTSVMFVFLWRVYLTIQSSDSMIIVSTVIFWNDNGSFSTVKYPHSPFRATCFSIFSAALRKFHNSRGLSHLNGRLEVAELNGAKFFGTAHGSSSAHTHTHTQKACCHLGCWSNLSIYLDWHFVPCVSVCICVCVCSDWEEEQGN